MGAGRRPEDYPGKQDFENWRAEEVSSSEARLERAWKLWSEKAEQAAFWVAGGDGGVPKLQRSRGQEP
eukprot:3409541-Alexandrium_andersonii.AAC.2